MERIKECAGGLIVNPSLGVLVVLNSIDKNVFPKGGIEEGETALLTAIRESYEEAGLRNLLLFGYLGCLERPGYTELGEAGPLIKKNVKMFGFLSNQVDVAPTDGKTKKAFWLPPNELEAVLFWPQEIDFFTANRELMGV